MRVVYVRKEGLFVCGYNLDRSRTGEDLLRGKEGSEVKSAGTSRAAVDAVSRELVD
jgi:protein-tyrosine-phosphatase